MSQKIIFQSVTGMHDILPEDYFFFKKIEKQVEEIALFYGFERIETPILEFAELFFHTVGQSSDIVQKEMFLLKTKGDDLLALRPEGTAPVVRAYFQHSMQNLLQPVKLWYFGPFFRYEKPQLGRYRQFWQFGFEILGEKSPALDAQIIQIFFDLFSSLKIKNLVLKINSIGDKCCRPYYKKALVSYLKSRVHLLCPDCKRRIKENPLRVLDCKEEKCQQVISSAPQILDYLCENCKAHFKLVLEYLEELGLPYFLDPKLVRGLDYYTKTVFEIFQEGKEEIGALAGGGRYDGLGKILAKKELPAVGGAGGVERIVSLLREKTSFEEKKPKVFLAQLGEKARKKALKLFEEFRKAKILVRESVGKDSLKAQLRHAERLGVKYVLILGEREVLEGTIILKDMSSGQQTKIKLEKIISEIKKRLKNN
jgi:histidyl-tRNA synthetase